MQQAIEILTRTEILSDANKALLEGHPKIDKLTQALQKLDAIGLLNQAHWMDIVSHKKPDSMAAALIALNQRKILTSENRSSVAGYPFPKLFADNLGRLHTLGILTAENRDALAKTLDMTALTTAWCHLKRAKIFNAENRTRVLELGERQIASEIVELNKAKILTQENFDFLCQAESKRSVATVLVNLTPVKSLDALERKKIFEHPRSDVVSKIIMFLSKTLVLNKENFDKLLSHPDVSSLLASSWLTIDPASFTQAHFDVLTELPPRSHELQCIYLYLIEAHLFTEENRALVNAFEDYRVLSRVFLYLRMAKILTQETFSLVTALPTNIEKVEKIFGVLIDMGLFKLENIKILCSSPNFKYGTDIIIVLHSKGLHSQQFFDFYLNHANQAVLSPGLLILSSVKILSSAVLQQLTQQENFKSLFRALTYLFRSKILTEVNFNHLSDSRHRFLLTDEANDRIWARIPAEYLTQESFLRLLEASKQAHPLFALQQQREQILGGFAAVQNTHSQSVHGSVSTSALRLKSSYEKDLNSSLIFDALSAFINGLEPSPKHLAAKRCMEKIKDLVIDYTDSSGVSLKQLLALAYLAIEDDGKRVGESMDAKLLLVEALYEIQRGYNLNEDLVDDGREDDSICPSGAFNKIMEKLNGIHADVEIYFITHASASAKFPMVAKQIALGHLRAIAAPQTLDAYHSAKAIFAKLKEDESLASIWPDIREPVSVQIWDEFQKAYADNPLNPKYLELLDSGIYVSLPEGLSAIEAELELASTRIPRVLGEHSMWSRYESGEEPQHKRLRIRD